jgi:hypothetical protein
MPLTLRPNVPWISSIKIGGGLNFGFHRKTERLVYRYLKPPANVAPTANAGSDQTITLPTSSVTLNGGGSSDSDGTIASYEWTQVNGPATAAIGSASGSSTSVSGLTAAGTYTFQLKVKDDDGAESTDTVVVTVNPQPMTTVYKDITITFTNLPAQNANGRYSLDLAHTLSAAGGWDANFQESDISSQITGSTDPSSYNNNEQVTITKEFSYDSQTIATLTITAEVEDRGGGDFVFNNVSYTPISNPIQISKIIPAPPPMPSIITLPSGAEPADTPLDNGIEDPPFNTAGYTLENPDFSAEPLRYIDDPDSPYALAEYFKNTLRFRILPHFDLEITGQKLETPLGSWTPFVLRERFEIGVEFTAVDVEVAAAAPEAAVKEIEDLAARDNAVSLALGNELQISSALDLLAVPGQITFGLGLQNRSYAADRYSASLKYSQDINYRALQSVSAKITGGFTQTGAGFWRGDLLANLLPAAETQLSRLTAEFNLFGENGAFGVGTAVVWRPLGFMEYGVYAGFQDVRRPSSVYGALAAKVYF